VAEGIVPGGGVALVRCIEALDELRFDDARQYGVGIVRRALEEPLRQIARNAGADPSVVVQRVREGKGAFGFNAETEVFEDLVKAGVIDPAKVVRAALQNASSVAGLLLTTEAIMAERPKPVEPLTPYPNAPQGAPSSQQGGPPEDDWEDH
jgi:chaperonin GroEL